MPVVEGVTEMDNRNIEVGLRITPSTPHDDLAVMLASMSDDARKHAEKLLMVYAEALNHAKSPQT